jgi:hypothetical protein
MSSSDQVADRFVSVTPSADGFHVIRLEVPGGEAVELGTYPADTARVMAEAICRVVAAAIRAGRSRGLAGALVVGSGGDE